MAPDNDLASRAKGARVLAKTGEVYAVQLPAGGALQQGRVKSIKGPGKRSLGRAPSDPGKDWVVLVKKN